MLHELERHLRSALSVVHDAFLLFSSPVRLRRGTKLPVTPASRIHAVYSSGLSRAVMLRSGPANQPSGREANGERRGTDTNIPDQVSGNA